MEEKTLVALKKSIEHWEKNAAPGDHPVSTKAKDCALCGLFFWEEDCAGCPVYQRTGREGCHGSPYWSVVDAKLELCADESKGRLRKKLREAAQKELDFLKSLLPEEDKD